MKIMTPEYKDRIRHWISILQDDFYTPIAPVCFEAARTMDELSIEEAMKLSYVPVTPGYTWGKEWEYCWFKGRVTLPEEARNQRIVMDLQPGGESTIFVDGEAFGTYRAPWVSIPSHYIVDNCLTPKGIPGCSYEILMETYAGHDFPQAPGWGCAVGPIIPGQYLPRIEKDDRRTLGTPTIGIWNEEAYQLFLDADTLYKLLSVLDDSTLRAAKVAEALEKFSLTVDFEQEREERIASYKEARKVLQPALEAVNGSTMPRFYAIGNAHLDLAWLWPMAETYRKTARTFAAQLRLMEEYPEYRFLQSQPAAYEMCRQYYPELFSRIGDAVKKGNWIADGAMWVEPDTNLAGGEALIRQLLYGLAYYEDVLGVKSRVLWLPDSFGYSGALPQILQKSGVEYLVTQKIFWSYNEGERFPYHYFKWEGIDGSGITAFLPTSYTYQTDPSEIGSVWRDRIQARDLDAFLLPYGYGDGGGGPARDHVEYLRRERDLEGMPRVEQSSPAEFFDDLQRTEGGPRNTYHGELYFDAHRGTYTTQAIIKKNNRKAELALRDMEIWDSAAKALGNWQGYSLGTAEKLWKELLLHQFHDILPGSGIARIYTEADERVRAVIFKANELTDKAVHCLAGRIREPYEHQGVRDDIASKQPVSIFNSLSFSTTAVVALPDEFEEGAITADGTSIPIERTKKGIRGLVSVPPVGSISLYPGQSEGAENVEPKAHITEDGDGYLMENDQLRARINRRGEIISFVLKETCREFAGGKMNVFRLFKDIPRTYDAWDIDSNYVEQEIPALENAEITVEQSCGLKAVLKLEGKISQSAILQRIILRADARRLEFETTIDWKELHRLLKVSFPVNVYAENGINEIQFGYIERPVKRSRQYEKDRFEVCNHRYSVLCDGNHGAAVLNDCKYGISMNNNALELTLLRAAASPEMRTDNREHKFTYAFTAFEGSFAESDVIRQAWELNVPVRTVRGIRADFSMINIDRSNILLETIKAAEDGSDDMILRFYEAAKAPVNTRISTPFTGRAWICDLRENKLQEIQNDNGEINVSFRAFDIITIRMENTCKEKV